MGTLVFDFVVIDSNVQTVMSQKSLWLAGWLSLAYQIKERTFQLS